jgi:GntR family transcriptional repressor for pyruvate dehydrogenase complex
MAFSPILHPKTSDIVIETVESLILDGALRPGEKLPPERSLATQLGVSRPILREALQKLEEKGLLVTKKGEGTYIANVIGSVFADPVVDVIRNSAKGLHHYLEFRREIEGIAAGLAAKRATEADRKLLIKIRRDMLEWHEKKEPDEESRLDLELHGAIVEAAHNVVFLHVLRACYKLLADDVFSNRQKLYKRNEHEREKLLQEHLDIIDAILAGNSEGATAAAHTHIDHVAAATADLSEEVDRLSVAEKRLALRTAEPHTVRKRRY